MSTTPIRALLIDDDRDEFRLVKHMLSKTDAGIELEWASTYEDGFSAMQEDQHDVYLVDYMLGPSNGLELIRVAKQAGCQASFIMLTGYSTREVDLAAMKAGAEDFLVKGKFGAELLERAIRYAVERRRAKSEREKLIAELKEALQEIKTLSGFLPICTCCKKIRDDTGYWNQVESYIKDHSEAELSQSLCPDCAQELFQTIVEERDIQNNHHEGQ